MRKLAACGVMAVLAAGLGVAVARAADDDTEARPATERPSGIRWNPALIRMFGGNDRPAPEKKPEKKPDAKSSARPAKKTETSAKQKSQADEAAAEQAREKAVLFRRLAVCDKLKQVASSTNDANLQRRAEELEERAWTTFNQRTACMRPGESKFESDEQVLDKHLGQAAGKKAAGDPQAYTVSSKDRNSRTVPKEEVDQ